MSEINYFPATTPATSSARGVVALAGDLFGTADLPRASRRAMGVYDLREFAAGVIDGTDISTPLQAAVNAVPAYIDGGEGGIIQIPPGDYTLGTAISITTAKLVEFRGTGSPGYSSLLGGGTTRIQIPAGVVGITYGPTSGTWYIATPTFRDLHFQGPGGTATSSTGALYIRRTSNWLIENCTFSDFAAITNNGATPTLSGAGYGVKVDTSQYGRIRDSQINNCFNGLIVDLASVVLEGCTFDGNNNLVNPSNPPTTTRGVWLVNQAVIWSTDCQLQSYGTLIDFDAGATAMNGSSIMNPRMENYRTAVRFHASAANSFYTTIVGGSWSSGVPSAVSIDLDVNSGDVFAQAEMAVGVINDVGFRNNIVVPRNYGVKFRTGGYQYPLTLNTGATHEVGFYVANGSPSGWLDAQPGSLYFNANGGASVTLYVKETALGNLTWRAV